MATTTVVLVGRVGDATTSDETQIVDERFTSSFDAWVRLKHLNLQASTTVVQTINKLTTFTEGAINDYVMDDSNGMIKVLSTGTMLDATEYYIAYHYNEPNLAWKVNQVTNTASVVKKVAITERGKMGIAVVVYTP